MLDDKSIVRKIEIPSPLIISSLRTRCGLAMATTRNDQPNTLKKGKNENNTLFQVLALGNISTVGIER
jgi:ribosomal protein S19E (S16A)